MKVWLLHVDSYGEVSVYAEDTDVLEIPFVKTELEYLGEDYKDEREDFLFDVNRAIRTGRGTASIEERFRLELVNVK